MSAPVMDAVAARSLVAPAFFARLSRRVATAHGLTTERAEAITDQALAYLATSAVKEDGAPTLYMSAAVDPAWHEFMLYTAEYDEFFAVNGWRKVHHNPCDGGPTGDQTYPPAAEVLPLTVEAIARAGYVVRPELWQARVDCGDTCGDDGKGGNPLPTCEHNV